VLTLNESACHLLYALLIKFSNLKKSVLFTYSERMPLLRRFMKAKLGKDSDSVFRVFEDDDPALEWCENRLLEVALPQRGASHGVNPAEYDLFEGFTAEELVKVSRLLERRVYARDEVIINVGDEANHLFFLARGCVSVLVTLSSGASKRLATFSSGMGFGEMAIIDHAPRSAMIRADTEVECDLLSMAHIAEMGRSNPALKIKLLENLSLGLCRKLRKANREMMVLE
jgi:glutaminase